MSSIFGLLMDLGTIVVPSNYFHATALANFAKKNHRRFYYYNDELTDANFLNPSRILEAGNVLYVSAWEQIVGGATTSIEHMDFLRSKDSIFPGAQGATLVFEQKGELLPKNKWYSSFDEPDRLWKDAFGDRRVPHVNANRDGGFRFGLGGFEDPWDGDDAFLCFRDQPLEL
jgi:hypothetical protein